MIRTWGIKMEVMKVTNTGKNLHQALSAIGDKWSMQIILHLYENEPVRFNACQEANGINSKTLTQRLQALGDEGLVAKQEYKEYPPRVEYVLTEQGKALVPVIKQLSKWAEDNL